VHLTISAVDLGSGVVTLSDGSRWQVGPGDAGTVAGWAPGRPAALVRYGPLRRLRSPADGPEALVCPAPPVSPSRLISPGGPPA
jgi:hypothetical protein